MKKILLSVLVMVFVLMIAGCGNSNSEEGPIGADSQMAENAEQTDTEAKAASGNKDGGED